LTDEKNKEGEGKEKIKEEKGEAEGTEGKIRRIPDMAVILVMLL
jgi:hypothetical protein